MRVKIISDGSPMGTRIVDPATGKQIENVRRVSWSLGVDDLCAVATLELVDVPVEVEGEAEGKER